MNRFFGDRPRGKAKFLLAIPVWIALVGVVVGIVMLLWNWLMPELFDGARSIDYWQAAGLILLCKILFSGGHGRWKHHHHRHWGHHMTPEEREQLRQRFKSRWGERWGGPSGAAPGEADKA